ncbi:hypothetical protein AR457_00555 [Streptomyces agglomeratus]|uniref:Uncharacterized protein n=1 Tax=Streptomyces agglomeratus TaxID=285458 RepID=A0A1E5P166_9ACTN|nr:hypothetical protein [Streptomyces agglomeratus]OEJ23259.1 hypothetical protein AS594_00760 [Streptomyces agglomeratus]OEJ42833.1 hypothetical protein AR457_00555 [Streptomyces agglomeratus]OEJ55237.1 hypothetical protein BGK72_35155 [Streptomyces agglomeratus]
MPESHDRQQAAEPGGCTQVFDRRGQFRSHRVPGFIRVSESVSDLLQEVGQFRDAGVFRHLLAPLGGCVAELRDAPTAPGRKRSR